MEQSSATKPPEHVGPPVAPPSKFTFTFTKKTIIIAAVVAAILVCGGVVAFMATRGDKDQSAYNQSKLSDDQKKLISQDDPFAQQYLRGCKERDVAFTSLPIAADQFAYFEPLGKVTDGHVTPTDHIYAAGKNAPETDDILMPADGTVIEISAMPAQYIGDKAQQTAPEDHRLVISHSCRYVSIFIHAHKLAPALQAAVGTMQPNTQKQVNIELKAGDKLGKLGQSVDWTLADATKTLTGFITPKLYVGESWKIHTIDPVSVYTGDLRAAMIAASLRTTEPYGGKIDYDKAGTLQGNWFREGTNGYMGASQDRYYDGHLSIAPNYLDTTSTTISLGNWQGKATQFTAKNPVDPATVTKANNFTKYEVIDMGYVLPNGGPWSGGRLVKGLKINTNGPVRGVIAFQVQDGEKLKVELFPNKSAAEVTGFTSTAQLYVR